MVTTKSWQNMKVFSSILCWSDWKIEKKQADMQWNRTEPAVVGAGGDDKLHQPHSSWCKGDWWGRRVRGHDKERSQNEQTEHILEVYCLGWAEIFPWIENW